MKNKSLPQMTEAAYSKVREAFRRSVPGKVTVAWVMANVDGYRIEASARSLIANLRLFGLVDDTGSPTDVAMDWRIDEKYAASCEILLRNAFPSDIVDAVSGVMPPQDVLERLFMNHGVGLGSAKNLTRIFRLVASKELPLKNATKAAPGKPSSGAKAHGRRRVRADRVAELEHAPLPPSDTGVTVLRYFLERGRLAELRVPADLEAKEKRRIFAHLRIDLLDEVGE